MNIIDALHTTNYKKLLSVLHDFEIKEVNAQFIFDWFPLLIFVKVLFSLFFSFFSIVVHITAYIWLIINLQRNWRNKFRVRVCKQNTILEYQLIARIVQRPLEYTWNYIMLQIVWYILQNISLLVCDKQFKNLHFPKGNRCFGFKTNSAGIVYIWMLRNSMGSDMKLYFT